MCRARAQSGTEVPRTCNRNKSLQPRCDDRRVWQYNTLKVGWSNQHENEQSLQRDVCRNRADQGGWCLGPVQSNDASGRLRICFPRLMTMPSSATLAPASYRFCIDYQLPPLEAGTVTALDGSITCSSVCITSHVASRVSSLSRSNIALMLFLRLHSSSNRGSLFFLYAPLHRGAASGPECASMSSIQL